MKGDYDDDPELAAAYALSRGEGIETDDPPLAWMAEQMRRFEAAPTREAKLAVLKDYMSDRQAENAIGIMLGERDGDAIFEG